MENIDSSKKQNVKYLRKNNKTLPQHPENTSVHFSECLQGTSLHPRCLGGSEGSMICGFGSHRASHSFGRRGKHTGNRQHTRGGRKCDERPKWIVERLNDAEVQRRERSVQDGEAGKTAQRRLGGVGGPSQSLKRGRYVS